MARHPTILVMERLSGWVDVRGGTLRPVKPTIPEWPCCICAAAGRPPGDRREAANAPTPNRGAKHDIAAAVQSLENGLTVALQRRRAAVYAVARRGTRCDVTGENLGSGAQGV